MAPTTSPDKVRAHMLVRLPSHEELSPVFRADDRDIIAALEAQRAQGGHDGVTALARDVSVRAALRMSDSEMKKARIDHALYQAYRAYFNTDFVFLRAEDLLAGALSHLMRAPCELPEAERLTLANYDLYFDNLAISYLRRGNLVDLGIFYRPRTIGPDSLILYLGRITHAIKRIPSKIEDLQRVVQARGRHWLKRRQLSIENPWLGALV